MAEFYRSDSHLEPIAIIGLACRFPGANDAAAFWELLRNGVDAITQVPADRWEADSLYDPDPAAPGKMNSKWGGFVEGIDRFDAEFFGISPREADLMDPQQRMLLEAAWHALEDAAIAPASLAKSATGVFVGLASSDYTTQLHREPSNIHALTASGGSTAIVSNRISYCFDLRGPSIAVDTACSSSLVALHLACQSLWTHESTLAMAGGGNLILNPFVSMSQTKSRLLSVDGRCRVFDAKANGFARGEGVGVVVLKRLGQAVADGDPIRAVIRATAVQQAGRTNGLMAPSRHAQEDVIRDACRRAGISPGAIGYAEGHSAGSAIGDAAELNALGAALATGRPAGEKCPIGSVKTNVGHLEAAAGMAALIKTVLMLDHRELVPTLHFESPNAHVPFASLPLHVQRAREPWQRNGQPLLAGVGGAGFGGVYAYVVLEEPPENAGRVPDSTAQLLALSARNPAALRELAQAYVTYLERSEVRLDDVCRTAATGRAHFPHRIAIVAYSTVELRDLLRAVLDGNVPAGVATGIAPRRAPADLASTPAASLAETASRYVRGAALPEPLFGPMSSPRLNAMPAYPFQRQRHWVTPANLPVTATATISFVSTPAPVAETKHPALATTVEQRVVQIFRQVLAKPDVSAADNFFELGGGSLMALDLMSQVEKTFGVQLKPAVLLERPTAELLAIAIDMKADSQATPLIVTTRAEGNRPPVFLLTPGHLFQLTSLSRRLLAGHPVHAMAFPDQYSTPGITIQGICDGYLRELNRVYPEGPFHLFGFCVGGVVAYQMAHQLTRAGRQPLSIGLLDAPCPPPHVDGTSKPRHGRMVYFASRCLAHAQAARTLPLNEMVGYISGRAKFLPTVLRLPGFRAARPEMLAIVAHREAVQRYVPGPYSGELDLYLASEPWPSVAEDTRSLWRTLAPRGRTSHFHGFHDGLLKEPRVADIADRLNARLAVNVTDEPVATVHLPRRTMAMTA